MKKWIWNSIVAIGLFSCSSSTQEQADLNVTAKNDVFKASITELTDAQYPDNPDISIRSKRDGEFSHNEVLISLNDNNTYDLIFTPKNSKSDTLLLSEINLSEWIPTIPAYLTDAYARKICVINQEWNRHQVKFLQGEFSFKTTNEESNTIKRVDLARNCLNAYLWEIIAYCEEDGILKPCYHGWFDFPKDLYAQMFEKRNTETFDTYASSLENWKDPENKHLDLNLLRHIYDGQEVEIINHNTKLYPLIGERKKKEINIVRPRNYSAINDFLTDSTEFATFTPPGFYNTSDPRKTELSKLKELQTVQIDHGISNNANKDSIIEIQLVFKGQSSEDITLMVIGIEENNIPTLDGADLHKGYQMPMGIANHSFYESYTHQQNNSSLDSPFYALLFDKEGNWIDSHKLGIDGPLFYKDKTTGNLHVLILSFERHAFVGHYELLLK